MAGEFISYFFIPVMAGMVPLLTGVLMARRYRLCSVMMLFVPAAVFVPVWAGVQLLNIQSGSGDFSGFAVIVPPIFAVLNGVFLSVFLGALCHLLVHRFVSRRSRGSVLFSWALLLMAGGLLVWKGWMFYAWPWTMERF